MRQSDFANVEEVRVGDVFEHLEKMVRITDINLDRADYGIIGFKPFVGLGEEDEINIPYDEMIEVFVGV